MVPASFPGHVGIESVVASAWSHDHNLLPRSRKWKLVVLLSALPQGCSAEGLLLLEGDTVVLLSSFGSMFGDLVCCVISWKTTVGWYPRHDYSPVLRDLMKVFCETGYFVSCSSFQDLNCVERERGVESDLFMESLTKEAACTRSILLGPFWFRSARPLVCTLKRTCENGDPCGWPIVSW